jgi:hypothetical protein
MTIEDEMINYMLKELASLLIEEHPELSLEEATDQVFNSVTYQKVIDTSNGLYSQSRERARPKIRMPPYL